MLLLEATTRIPKGREIKDRKAQDDDHRYEPICRATRSHGKPYTISRPDLIVVVVPIVIGLGTHNVSTHSNPNPLTSLVRLNLHYAAMDPHCVAV